MINQLTLDRLVTQNVIPGIALSQIVATGDINSLAAGLCGFDHPHARPVTPSTVFQLASVSKFITACLVLELSKLRIIDVEEPLEWRVNSGSSPTTTTFAALLCHRAGFTKNIGFAFPQTGRDVGSAYSSVAESCGHCYNENMRGFYQYSGCSYWLIQRLLEQRLESSFESLLQTWICHPFSLHHTSCHAPDPANDSVAFGHDEEGKIKHGGWCTFERVEAAAGIWSTAQDLGVLLQRLLQRNSSRGVRRPSLTIADLLIRGQGSGYHHGILLNHVRGTWYLSHRGMNPGYQAMISINLCTSSATAALINRECCDTLLNILAFEMD